MNKPEIKFVFVYYKFQDKRIGDSIFGYEEDDNIGVIICPKCGDTVRIKPKRTVCVCGTTINIK